MQLVNGLLLLALFAGHCELVVTAINRLHALPLPGPVLKTIRHAHDVWMLVFPGLLLWKIGLTGPALLSGGYWRDISPLWRVYLGASALGAVGLMWTGLRYQFRRPPAARLSNHSQAVDIAENLGGRPFGRGPYQLLARAPLNEIFQLEITQKTLRIPRLPLEWDGLSILHLSDLHFIGTLDLPFFEEVIHQAAGLQADLVVFTGDLLDNQQLIDWLPDTLGQLSAPLGCYYILGNHDWYLDPAPIREALVQLGWRDVSSRSETIDIRGRRLMIAGSERPWMGEHPDLATPADAFKLLLSHTPDNLRWAKRHKVDLMLSGHNHGGQVVLPLFGPVYSPSIYGCKYAAGVFWEPPTLLHVSRGISGRHPLRWRCRPELAKLILKADEPSKA